MMQPENRSRCLLNRSLAPILVNFDVGPCGYCPKPSKPMKSKAMAPKTLHSRVAVSLSRADIEWIAGLAACVVRFNQLAKPPEDWREIPAWLESARSDRARSTRLATRQMRQDIRRATSVLTSLVGRGQEVTPEAVAACKKLPSKNYPET